MYHIQDYILPVITLITKTIKRQYLKQYKKLCVIFKVTFYLLLHINYVILDITLLNCTISLSFIF